MNTNDGKISFGLGLDTAELQRDAKNATKIFSTIGDDVEREGQRIDNTFKNIGKAAAAYFTATQIWEFGRAVVNARKEIESFEISFETLLGSKDKSSAFFAEIKDFAVKTPLQLNDIAGAAQTLLGFGISAEKVMPILRQLGDVSMGNAERFKSLALAFSQATSAGKLQGQDLLQMINAGFNPLNEIAKKTGKSIGELKDDMAKGKISAQDLADALSSATAQGGQFYGMLEKQSKGVEGALSNLQGAWNDMLNDIGTKGQGVFVDAVGMATDAVKHYEDFAKVILSVAAAYGTYKAALMSTVILEKAKVAATMAKEWYAMGKAVGFAAANQTLFNSTLARNPYALLALAILSVVTALTIYNQRQNEHNRHLRKNNDILKQQREELDKLGESRDVVLEAEKDAAKSTAEEISRIETLSSAIHDETNSIDDRRKAIKQMQSIVPNYHAQLDNEGKLHRDNTEAIDKHIESLNRLATAKALQAKREELVAQRVNAELDRRANVRRRDTAQAEVDAATAEYDTQKKISQSNVNAATGGSSNLFAGSIEMQMASQGAAAANANALNAASARLQVANSDLKVIDGAIDIADKSIAKAKEGIADLDAMLADYKPELKKIEDEKNRRTTDAKTLKKEEKYSALQDKQAEEEARAAKDLAFAVRQAEIDAMAEGESKVLEQMELNHAKEMEELERQKTDYLRKKVENARAAFEANPNNTSKVFDGSNIALSEGELKAFEQRRSALEKKWTKEKADHEAEKARMMNEYLKEYGEYEQKRAAIIALFTESIAKATTEGEKKTLEAQMTAELSAIDIKANEKTAAISKLFSDMKNSTVAELRKIAKEGQAALDFLTAGVWNEKKGKNLGMSKETFETLRKSPEELAKVKKAIDDITKSADNSENALNKLGNGLNKMFSKNSSKSEFLSGLSIIEEAINEITGALGFLSNSLAQMGDALGNSTMSDISEGLNVAIDAANSTMEGAKAGSAFGPVGAVAGAAIGLVSSLTTSLSKLHDKKHEKKIVQLQERIEGTRKAYDDLAREVERTYSKDAAANIEEQNKNLEQQISLIKQQQAEEAKKKKTDQDRIDAWQDEIEQIQQQIKDNEEKAVDAIFGEDLKAAIDNFANAYAEAWANGEDRAKSAKDTVKAMMRQMVTESIKAAIQSSQKMEEIRKKLEQFYADNILSQWEQDYVYNLAEKLQSELDSQFGWADSLLNDSGSDREGVKKGIATASQESVDENNARLTTIQGHTYTLVQNSAENKAQIAAAREHLREIRELAQSGIQHLEDISRNTYQLYETNERLRRVENELSSINTRGVTIRN